MGGGVLVARGRLVDPRHIVSAAAVSIVIPTWNGIATLPRVLEAIAGQVFDGTVETVVVDSGSTDGTIELVERKASRVLRIDRQSFNHGLTRNLAIEAARGEHVVLLSQDAEPANDRWLSQLVAPLRERAAVAGSFARQLPRPESGAIVRHYHHAWQGSSPDARVARIDDEREFDRLPPLEQMQLCTFDNVCSCIRRSVWETHRFRETPIAEDLEWAREVLMAGFEIAYVPDAAVVHSHDRSAAYEYRRTALLHQRLHALFGVQTIPSVGALGRAVASTLRLHLRVRRSAQAGERVEGLGRAVALALAWPAGQYVGARRSVRDRPIASIGGV